MSKFFVGQKVKRADGCEFSHGETIATISRVDVDKVWFEETCTYLENHKVIAFETVGPIRTVTRREIVPGQYGHIEISDVNEEGASLWLPRNKRWTSGQLREAAHVLNQIAEVLEDE